MKLKLLLIVVPATFLLWVLATAVLAQEELPPPYVGLKNPFPWSDASAQEAGKGLYQSSCLGCHGASGSNIAKADLGAVDYPQRLEGRPDFYFWLLSEGRLDKGMPPFKSSLSEEQRWQVLTYIWSLGTEAVPQEVMPPAMIPPAELATPLDCLSCHARVLIGHDKLGSGSEACQVCHDRGTMGVFRLFDGTQLLRSESPLVCGQCHIKVYQSWEEEKHGIASVMMGGPRLSGDKKKRCITCHNPHQPKIELSRIIGFYPRPVPEEGAPPDCLSCHIKVLVGHDKLGSGSVACRTCHSNTQMGVLHFASGETNFPMSESPRLCAQCHQKRYEAWKEGTHGMPAWQEGTVVVHGTEQVGCISCHDPHQPQMTLLGITKPHPAPAPSPSPPSATLVVLLSLSVLLVIVVGVVIMRRGGQQ